MNGKYLATNIEPLKSIADGRVLDLLESILADRNKSREENSKGKLVAYEIRNLEMRIASINFIIGNENGLHFRYFEYYQKSGTVDDCIEKWAKFGFGIHDPYLEEFLELQSFYLENKK